MILGVLQDELFGDASKLYGSDLISKALVAEETQNSLQKLLLNVLKDKEVNESTILLLN